MISWGWLSGLLGTGAIEETQEKEMSIEPLDLASVNFQASPNKSRRKGEVKYIGLHHTGPGSYRGIVNWLCNPDAKASAHYVIGLKGELTQLINTKWESWHFGTAEWNGIKINNHQSIGIEICNIGVLEKQNGGFYYNDGRGVKKYTGSVEPVEGSIYSRGYELVGYYIPYSEKQINKLVSLCKGLVKKYPAITKENILAHYQVAMPVGRKNDPFGLDIEKIKNMIFEE